MTTVTITLPDQLAEQAAEAGLLTPEASEEWVRGLLRKKALAKLSEAMDRIHAVDDPEPMSLEEIQVEVKAVRAERRAKLYA